MSHAIKNVPEGITGGFHRFSGGLHRVLAKVKKLSASRGVHLTGIRGECVLIKHVNDENAEQRS